MTPQQKNLITILVLGNLALFCCCGPALFIFADVGGSQSFVAGLIPTPGPTSTPKPTVAPTRPMPTTTLESGWKLYPSTKDGFALALPSTWVYQDLDSSTLSAGWQDLKKNNPQLVAMFENQSKQASGQGVKYHAADFGPGSSADGYITNLNVMHSSQSQTFTMDYLVGQSIKALEGMPGVSKPINHRRIQLPGGETEEFRYVLAVNLDNKQTLKIALTQYAILQGKETCTITFGTPLALDSKYFPIFEKIARTMRWLN